MVKFDESVNKYFGATSRDLIGRDRVVKKSRLLRINKILTSRTFMFIFAV